MNARAAAFALLKLVGHLRTDFGDLHPLRRIRCYIPRKWTDNGFVPTEHLFQRIRRFRPAGAGAGRVDRQFQQIAFTGVGGVGEGVKRALTAASSRLARSFFQPLRPGPRARRYCPLPGCPACLLGQPVLVDADDGFLAGVDLRLAARRRFLDAHLGQAGFDGLGHAAQLSTS
jgi:hypothetical protein